MEMVETANPLNSRWHNRRFLFLSVALIILLLAYPFWQRTALGVASFDLVFWGVMLTSIYTISSKHWSFYVGIVLAAPALATDIAIYFNQNADLVFISCLLDLLFLLFITSVIIAHVVRQECVNLDKILGAISAYLLLGLVWALIYGALELAHPGSFQMVSDSMGVLGSGTQIPHWGDLDNFIYYSLVTLSTLGYGDIIAVTRAARSLSALEAIVGQLYLAILLARLIGLQIIQAKTADA